MCLEEFKDIFEQCKLFDEDLQERDVNLAFNQSMMT